MALPNDFSSVLAKVEAAGILDEDPQTIENRLALSVQSAVLKSGQRDIGDLGIGDWTLGVIARLKKTLHAEMCDAEKKALKDDYRTLLEKGLTPEGITAVATVVSAVVATINPALAVSSIIIFLAVWLLKRGLNRWCSAPA